MLKRLAVGGMAELYLAKDNEHSRLVVIKRILPYLAQEAEFVRMFLDEARIAAQLHHPNIIQLYELGKLEGSIFIAMEFVEGVDLRKILQQEQKKGSAVPPYAAAWLTARLCDGLHYAHHRLGADGRSLGIIHRDVSPQNLMVGYRGEVKLVDFGIAKAAASMERSKPGVIKGKFLYLSPEQLSQERIDHRADLFALGTMLYEVTVGKSPFHKPTTEAVIYAIRAEDPAPPHLIRPNYPQELSRIVMRCLVKDRAKRYQQAVEVLADLEAWMKREAPTSQASVQSYVDGLFGGEDDRTGIFIPMNARREGEEHSGIVRSPTSERTRVDSPRPRDSQPGVLATPSAPWNTLPEETTKPIGTPRESISNPGRKPTPSQPIEKVSGSYPRPPVAKEAKANEEDVARTQTVRPRDLLRAQGGMPLGSVITQPELTRPPERKNSGLTLPLAGLDDVEPTAISHSGAIPVPPRLDSNTLTPVMPTEPMPARPGARPTSDSIPSGAPLPKKNTGPRAVVPAPRDSGEVSVLTPSTERSQPRKLTPSVDSISYQSLPGVDESGQVMVKPPRGNTNETVNDLPPTRGTPPQPPPPPVQSQSPLARISSEPMLMPKQAMARDIRPEDLLPEESGANDVGEPTVKERSTENPTYDPDDDRSTADYRAHLMESIPKMEPVRTRVKVNGLLLASIGAVALLVVLLLIYWLGGDTTPPPKKEVPMKLEPANPHRDDIPAREVTHSGGEGADALTQVKFVAPANTVITHDGKVYAPNVVHRLYPGTFTYSYRCPVKKKGTERTINATAPIDSPKKEPQLIELCKP
ncbi:MAG: protein kinase [Myxococcaceae bacterium]